MLDRPTIQVAGDGNRALSDIVADDAFNDVMDDGDEDDDEVVAVNAADENAVAVAMASPRPQSLPAFVGGGVGASSAVSTFVVSHLVMYRTKVLMYRTMVLLARLTKVRR
jgi:hypothetical protein